MSVSYKWDVATEDVAEMLAWGYAKAYGFAPKKLVHTFTFTLSGYPSCTFAAGDIYQFNLNMMQIDVAKYRGIQTRASECLPRLASARTTLDEAWTGDAALSLSTELLIKESELKAQIEALGELADGLEAFAKAQREFRSKYAWDRRTNIVYLPY